MKRHSVLCISIFIFVAAGADDELPETNDAVLLQLLQQTKEHSIIRQPWRPIQEEVHDTVVQLFSQVAEIDMLQPYKTPAQYGVRGSGFIINEQGDIITNAHVVEQAIAVWIQIPSLGKRLIDVSIIGICPERDLALLRMSPEGLALLREHKGYIAYLTLGDSDTVHRADEVLALGYPLGQESLKSTTGVISGCEKNLIQMSAPINPGSSGGPLLNVKGQVIGINTSGFTEAQNIGYIIPVNELRVILPDLYTTPLLRKPYMGVLHNNATESLITFLGNPLPGGVYVAQVVQGSSLDKAGLQAGDMIYQVNGYDVDMYGEIKVPWSEDKISVGNYLARIPTGKMVDFAVYRTGTKIDFTVTFDCTEPLPIRRMYPQYEAIDYEAFGGMVAMELTLNHIKLLLNQIPGLSRYLDMKNQVEPALIITHIFPNSELFKSRTVHVGATINEVNGKGVKTLAEYRQALLLSRQTGYITLKVSDNITRTTDNIFVVLPFAKIMQEESMLSQLFHYPMSALVQQLA